MNRKENIVAGQYYHIYNRIIFNIPEFKNKKIAARLVQTFLIANSVDSSETFQFLRNHEITDSDEIFKKIKKAEKLVNILCYAVMPDHYHFLLQEVKENGISKFLQKCNTSIAKYINIKNERMGPLFESRFKSKHIKDNRYLLHLSAYIHLNPLDFLYGKEWRQNELINWPAAKTKLIDYPWSSLKAFLNKNHKDSIISGAEIITDQFENPEDYERFLKEWCGSVLINEIDDIIID